MLTCTLICFLGEIVIVLGQFCVTKELYDKVDTIKNHTLRSLARITVLFLIVFLTIMVIISIMATIITAFYIIFL